MLHGIDHVIIAAPDPDAAAAQLEAALGLTSAGGGRHDGLGTFNRLAWLADGSYLELIGVDDEEAARSWPLGAATLGVLASGGGFVGYALDDRPLEPDVRMLRRYGSEIGDVTEGRRVGRDGAITRWRTAVPPRIGPDGLPFLIEHVITGAEWDSRILDQRAQFRYPIGSPVLLVGLELATDEPAAVGAEYSKQLQMDIRGIGDTVVASVGRQAIRLVPRNPADAPVTVRLGAEVEPRTVDLLGLRFVVERVELPLPA